MLRYCNNDGVYADANPTPLTSYIWEDIGKDSVTLRVRDNTGATGSLTKTVSVNESIVLSFDTTGGLGVKIAITNKGTANANDFPWQIRVQGGILGRINKTVNGTIDISAGDTVNVKTGMLLGFCAISINAKVANEEQGASGIQLMILSIVSK